MFQIPIWLWTNALGLQQHQLPFTNPVMIATCVSDSVAGTIAAFMVLSRQDYANYSTSTADVNKLRRAQNPLSRHHDGLSAQFSTNSSHWLPDRKRTELTITTLSHKIFAMQQTTYITLLVCRLACTQRSFDHHLLQIHTWIPSLFNIPSAVVRARCGLKSCCGIATSKRRFKSYFLSQLATQWHSPSLSTDQLPALLIRKFPRHSARFKLWIRLSS